MFTITLVGQLTPITNTYQTKLTLKGGKAGAKFEFQHESLKGKFSLILFVYNLMIEYSKNSREIYPRCFETKENETRIKN